MSQKNTRCHYDKWLDLPSPRLLLGCKNLWWWNFDALEKEGTNEYKLWKPDVFEIKYVSLGVAVVNLFLRIPQL